MVLDSSAVIAILQQEAGAERLVEALEADPRRFISAANLVETALVMQIRYGDHGEREVDLFITRLGIEVVPVSEEQAELARAAFRRYGKGRHPAGLNYGDCFAYALAMALNEPLLFVGEDFGQTDVRVT